MTVVVSQGQLKPTSETKSWPLAGAERGRMVSSTKGMDLLGLDITEAYGKIYAAQPWIYALVNKLSRNIARLPLKSYREDADPETEAAAVLKPRDHALPALLKRPYPRGSKFKLVESLVGSVGVYGHALWWKWRPRPGATPAELWPIDWRYITIKTGDDVPIEHFEYRGPAGRRLFMPEDVLHFEWWSPNGVKGTSPLEPLRTTLSIEDAAQRYSLASFQNGIRPSGALVSPKPVVGEQRRELKEEIEAIHSNPDNAFRMMLLDNGLDWKQFGQSAADAELIQLRKLDHVEACAVYDMPPPMVHILDRATFSNIDEQHQMLYVDTIGPWLGMIEDTIDAQLIAGEPTLELAFDEKDGEFDETRVAFDLTELLRPDIAKRAEAYKSLRDSGGYTINDVRAMENKPRIEHPAADSVLIPLNMEAISADGSDLGLAPRGSPVQAAMLTLADHLERRSAESASEVKAMVERLERTGQTELAEAVLELAGKIAEREPTVVNVPEQKAPELHMHEGAIKTDLHVASPAAPDVVHLEAGAKTKRVELQKDPETGRTVGATIVEE
jgi:HK97 family phage portal protein